MKIADDNLREGFRLTINKQAAAAIPKLNVVINLTPGYPHGYAVRGLAYYVLGSNEKGLIDINKALSIDNNYATAYLFRSLIYCRQIKIAEGWADFRKAVSLDPKLNTNEARAEVQKTCEQASKQKQQQDIDEWYQRDRMDRYINGR